MVLLWSKTIAIVLCDFYRLLRQKYAKYDILETKKDIIVDNIFIIWYNMYKI